MGQGKCCLSEIPALDTRRRLKNHHRRCFGETLRHVRLWAGNAYMEVFENFKNIFRNQQETSLMDNYLPNLSRVLRLRRFRKG